MATLEERIQNLTQDINPMGAMSDMDAERLMIIQQPQEFISNPKGQSTKLRMEAMLRLPKGSLSDSDALRMLQMMGGELNTQALPSVYQTLKSLVGDSRNETVGSGVMSDRDAQRVMAALGDNNRAGRIFKDNENFFREMRIGDEVVYKGDNQVMSQDVFRAENPYARPTVASESTRDTMSDIEGDMVMNAMPDAVRANKSLLSGVPDPMMSGVDTSIMQPLVEMGFEKQVRVILSTPQNSPESIEAQHQIINEMGTGMDIDAFVQTIREVAPPAIQEELLRDRMQPVGAMSNIDAEGINQLMRFAVKQKVDESNNPLLQLGVETGRMNDTTLGHLSEGEAVIPAEVLEANPQAAQSLDQTMTEMGINPDSRIVDTTGQINGIASINPETGLQEFGIGSSFQKFRRKVLKPVAKIAAVVPGPWQAPAIIYNKLESGYNIASGKGGIGDLMTVMAGGTQKVGGEGGAWDRIKSGDFAKEGGGTGFFDSAGKALKNIGSVDGKFNPLQYGKNIASTYRDDQVGGYFGLLGGAEPQPYTDEEIDGMLDTMSPEMVEQTLNERNMQIAKYKSDGPGTNPLIKQAGNLLGFGGADDLKEAYGIGTGTQVDKDGNVVNTNTTSGGMGMMGKLGIAGLAGLIGKLAYEEAKNQKGVPLTPLTQMDQLGRYNIAAEMARQAGEGSPSRVEYGLNPEGMPALSGGSPRMAAYGGIMNLNMGGMPRYNYGGGVQYFNQGGMPRYNYGGGVQYFNQGGAVAMAEGGDMDATINIEEFPAKDGQIDGPGTEVSDDIPAMLSDGEFVMTAKAVKGAGSFNINDNNGILTLTPNGDPSRDSGTRVMYKLMEHFGKVA
jgi:hypothetical protein